MCRWRWGLTHRPLSRAVSATAIEGGDVRLVAGKRVNGTPCPVFYDSLMSGMLHIVGGELVQREQLL